ncbi:TPA: IS30 family transposase [Staphylococcus aureus]|uniref:IS30 family transposase n=8 Tax=Staphylococcus aureus TaxID=1280 RepID=D2JDP4_STAAU|nr:MULTISPECIES: IS30 family transposase [Staphylococcus]ACZ68973.1 Integrase, catalytic region [Staphylococcus aureus]AJP19275.1 integrase [Staphylococcus aureus]ALH98125.1 integrase [Staphylococcus aureus]AWQ24306.1 IS30 family transposase [Staphylococcus aureus]AWQ27003.1 IS30 family transposase [Staphylococcus aureus]
MDYTRLNTDELTFIESYYHQNLSVKEISSRLKRSIQTIYNVINAFKSGMSALEYYQEYKQRKSNCGRHRIVLPEEQSDYIREKIADGWTPNTIIGRGERTINCSVKTLYRMFKENIFAVHDLPMKGKRKPNGHSEKRGRQTFKRNISERIEEFPLFNKEFGHLEGNTIVGRRHGSAIITLVERVSKMIITLRPLGRKATDIENALHSMFSSLPSHIFKSITFDCGKEFSNWKTICNCHDISIFFADPGKPSQRGLNEHSNGILRRSGLDKLY